MNIIENARWIRAKNDYQDVCPIFKKEFKCEKEIASVILHITAMGVYEATLNGSRVGNFIMAPGWTSYNKRHQYQSYDITNLVSKENCLEVTVGKGWYRGPLITWKDENIWGAFSALIAALDITYADGTKEVIITNKSWSVAQSRIKFSEIYDGEIYDASYTPSDWEKPVYFNAPKCNLIPQEGELVVEHEHLLPCKMITTPKGETVIDFGQNMTGYVTFSINAKAGDKIIYSHAEILDSDGNFYTDNLRTAKQRIEYICKDGEQTYKPHHTFMGFRYIRLDKAPSYIKLDDFKAIVVHSDMKRTGYFECSNEKVNKLFKNVIWGQRGNFLDIPTDCPQRDERLGWTGDAQVFVKTASYNFDVKKFFKKWLRDLAAEQGADGGVPIVIPNIIQDRVPGAAWGDAAVICPWQIYLTYGDKEILNQQIDSMTAWVEFMHSQGTEEFLWLGGNQYGDWLGMDAEDDSYRGASDKDFIASAYFAYSSGIVVKALKVLGRDFEYFDKLHNNVVKAFLKKYSDCKTQTECAITLVFGLTENKEKVAAKLAKLVRENGNKLTTGFVGTPYILEALSENGYTDIAYSLLLQEEYPSWLFSVNMGATTIWEHWDGLKEDGTMWSKDMNSFNHYAYGAVASWMYETVAGIRIDEKAPGFKHIVLCPKPDKRLEWAKASIETKFGVVSSSWKYNVDKVEYEFVVPTRATLLLDGKEITFEKGTHRL